MVSSLLLKSYLAYRCGGVIFNTKNVCTNNALSYLFIWILILIADSIAVVSSAECVLYNKSTKMADIGFGQYYLHESGQYLALFII